METLQLWTEAFPDPLTSPACYARALFINCLQVVTGADGWIRSFSRVVYLEVVVKHLRRTVWLGDTLSLFYGFSLAIKSPYKTSHPPVLILSFPLLEDLAVITSYKGSTDYTDGPDGSPTAARPSAPPMVGSLELCHRRGMMPIAR